MASGPYYQPGTYLGEVIEHRLQKAKTGTWQLVLRFKVIGYGDRVSYQPVQQYERAMYRALTDKTVEFVVKDLEQLGFESDSFSVLEPTHPHHVSLVGRKTEFYCKHTNDLHGQLRENWSISRPRDDADRETPTAKELREVDNLFGKALQKNKRATPAPQKATRTPVEDTEITDDDIPF